MKILVIAPYFYPKIGGLENYAWQISKGLHEKYGWDIVAITSTHEKNIYTDEVIEGIRIYRLPHWFKLSNTPINLAWFFTIANIIKKEKPDIINAHTPVPFIADIAALLSYLYNLPFILTYHNDLVKNNILDVIFKMYYRTVGRIVGNISRFIITTSPYYANSSDYLKKFIDKLRIIPPGVNISLIEKIEPDNDLIATYKNKQVILFVGQLDYTHQHKGLSYLIESMKLIVENHSNAHLLVIGKGDMIDEYKKMGENISMEILGNVDNQQLYRYYKLAEVVVLPSISDAEGFGMTLLEAAACKKPVVGSKVGGIPYVIDDEKTGLLCNPKDSLDLSQKIVRLLNNDVVAKKMGESGYEKVLHSLTWDKQITKTHQLFTSL